VHWGSCADFLKDAPALIFIPKYLSNGLVHTPRQRRRWIQAILPGSLDFVPASCTRYTFPRAPYFTLWWYVPSETTTLQHRPSLLIINASPSLTHLFTLPICSYTPVHMSTLYLTGLVSTHVLRDGYPTCSTSPLHLPHSSGSNPHGLLPFVWYLLLLLTTYLVTPEFYTYSQPVLWLSLHYCLRSLISLLTIQTGPQAPVHFLLVFVAT